VGVRKGGGGGGGGVYCVVVVGLTRVVQCDLFHIPAAISSAISESYLRHIYIIYISVSMSYHITCMYHINVNIKNDINVYRYKCIHTHTYINE